MTRFATSPAVGYITPQSSREVLRCTHHKAKTSNVVTLEVAHSSFACGHHSASNKSNVFGFAIDRSLICHLPRSVANPTAVRKYIIAQLARTCVRIIPSSKNKGSHFSLAEM